MGCPSPNGFWSGGFPCHLQATKTLTTELVTIPNYNESLFLFPFFSVSMKVKVGKV